MISTWRPSRLRSDTKAQVSSTGNTAGYSVSRQCAISASCARQAGSRDSRCNFRNINSQHGTRTGSALGGLKADRRRCKAVGECAGKKDPYAPEILLLYVARNDGDHVSWIRPESRNRSEKGSAASSRVADPRCLQRTLVCTSRTPVRANPAAENQPPQDFGLCEHN